MDKKTIIVAVIVSVVISLVFGGFLYSGKQGPTGPPGRAGVGSIPGSVVEGGAFTIGGVTRFYHSQSFLATSTAFCQVDNPFAATTTIVSASAVLINPSPWSPAQLWDLSTTSTGAGIRGGGGTGTSTPALMIAQVFETTGNATYSWFPHLVPTTTTEISGQRIFTQAIDTSASARQLEDTFNPFILGPSETLSWVYATATPGIISGVSSASPQGRCTAVLEVI